MFHKTAFHKLNKENATLTETPKTKGYKRSTGNRSTEKEVYPKHGKNG